MKICLRNEDTLCRKKWSIGINQNAFGLRSIWPPSFVGDTTNFKHWCLSLSGHRPTWVDITVRQAIILNAPLNITAFPTVYFQTHVLKRLVSFSEHIPDYLNCLTNQDQIISIHQITQHTLMPIQQQPTL